MEIKTTYTLELADRSHFCPKYSDRAGIEVKQVEIPCPELNRFLHRVVGADYRWGGREDWGRQEWSRYVDRPELETWILYVRGTPAGYFEQEEQADGSIRILNLGLLPQFLGQGLGAHLLSSTIDRAWARSSGRIWLRTCSHDHPHALANYQARGFSIVHQETGPANPPYDDHPS